MRSSSRFRPVTAVFFFLLCSSANLYSASSLHPLNTTTSELTVSSTDTRNVVFTSFCQNKLRIQSEEYAKLLSQSLGRHTERTQSVSRLNICTQELISRRVREGHSFSCDPDNE